MIGARSVRTPLRTHERARLSVSPPTMCLGSLRRLARCLSDSQPAEAVVDPEDGAELRLVRRACSRLHLDQIRPHGPGIQNISAADIEKTRIPFPPLPEQRRMVAKIDSLSANSKRARDQLDHVPKYKQAILAAAFLADLTRERRSQAGRRYT